MRAVKLLPALISRMDYSKIYDRLMARATNRRATEYTEIHHVIPRCMGGTDKSDNLVRLTAEEHFVAHKLLVKMYPTERGLVFGMMAMTMSNRGMRPCNKAFGWVRRLIAQALSESRKGVPRCPDMMAKIWAGNRGRVAPQHEREKISHGLKGKPKSPEHIAKVIAANKGRPGTMTGKTHSPETKERMRLAALARKHSAETKEKLTAFAASQTQEQRSARALKAWETKRAKKAAEQD
jgi:hypothetical protein